jgi:hypothetical protein
VQFIADCGEAPQLTAAFSLTLASGCKGARAGEDMCGALLLAVQLQLRRACFQRRPPHACMPSREAAGARRPRTAQRCIGTTYY